MLKRNEAMDLRMTIDLIFCHGGERLYAEVLDAALQMKKGLGNAPIGSTVEAAQDIVRRWIKSQKDSSTGLQELCQIIQANGSDVDDAVTFISSNQVIPQDQLTWDLATADALISTWLHQAYAEHGDVTPEIRALCGQIALKWAPAHEKRLRTILILVLLAVLGVMTLLFKAGF